MSTATDSKAVLEGFEPFVASVRHFVSLIEGQTEEYTPKTFLLKLSASMLEIATHGLLLDYAYIDREDFDPDPYDIHREEEAKCKVRLEQILAPLLQGALVEHIGDQPDYVRIELFSNDVTELYSDLVHGFRLWEVGSTDSRGEACWQWAFHKWHWHDHLYSALLGANLIRFTDDESGMTEKIS